MGKYKIEITKSANQDLKKHKKSGNKSVLNKIDKIYKELQLHPYTGIGKPEQLKHNLTGYWSRRINKKDRLVYKVEEDIVSAMGHYGDK